MQTKLKKCAECLQDKVIWKNHLGLKYCAQCWNKIKPQAPLKQSPIKSSQKPISKQSPKRKKLDAAYSILRKQFLQDHPMCQVHVNGVCTGPATQIHHSYDAGDREKYMNDTSTWFAVDFACHEFIHNNSLWAKEQGFLK